MSQNSVVYGITTSKISVGLSSIVGVSGGPYVNDIVLAGMTGGYLFMSGQSFGNNGSLIAVGANVNSDYYSVGGPASFYLAAEGATVVLTVIKKLSQGYNNYGAS